MAVRRCSPGAVLCALTLMLFAAMTAFYLIAGYAAYLDADMASELVMSQHLLAKHTLISRTWYHSSALRLLDTKLVYTPLMALFPGDWRLVRTLGRLILLSMLGAASYWCVREIGASAASQCCPRRCGASRSLRRVRTCRACSGRICSSRSARSPLVRALRRREGIVRMAALMLVFSGTLSLAAFVLLSGLYFDRYWLSMTALGVSVMMACLSREDNAVLRRLAALLFAGTVMLTGASRMFYSFRNPEVKGAMYMETIKALREQGLDKGYATFWNANILTELSNGELDVVSLVKADADGHAILMPCRWLETEENFEMDRPQEPVFLLLGGWETQDMGAFPEQTRTEKTGAVGITSCTSLLLSGFSLGRWANDGFRLR